MAYIYVRIYPFYNRKTTSSLNGFNINVEWKYICIY